MQTNKISDWIYQNLFVLLCGIGILLWWFLCRMIHPSVPILIEENNPVYLPIVGYISLACLSLPGIVYLFRHEFRELRWQEQLQSIGIVMMLSTIVCRPAPYLRAQIFFFAFTFIAFIASQTREWRKQPIFYYACWIYVICMSLSLLWTPHSREVSTYFNRLVPLASYSLAFAFVSLSKQNYARLLTIFWHVVCIACLLCVASGIYETQRLGFDLSEFIQFRKINLHDYFPFQILFAWSGAGHPSYNALWIMAGLTCSFYLADKQYISWFELAFGCMLTLFIVIATQSRVGSVMWLMIVFFGIIYCLRKYKYVLTGILVLSVGSVLAFCLMHLDAIIDLYSDPVRERIFRITYDYLHADPWVGCGLGGMTYEHMEPVIGYEIKDFWPQYPHNQFLGDWMQTGIIGLIVSLGIVGIGFYEAIHQRSFIGFVYMTAVFFFMLIEMPFRFLGGTTIIAFFLCFIFGHHNALNCDKAPDMPACDSSTRTK